MPYVPKENATNAESRSGGATDTGYYEATIRLDSRSDAHTTRHLIDLPTGIAPSVLLNWPFDDDGNINPRIPKKVGDNEAAQAKKVQNYADYLFGVALSCGYTKEELGEGYDETWLNGRTVYVGFVSGDDLGAQYGEIVEFVSGDPNDNITAEGQFAAWVEEGKLPKARGKRSAPTLAAARGEGGGSGRPTPPPRPSATTAPPKPTAAPAKAADNGAPAMPPPRTQGGPPRPPAARRP